MVDAKGDGGGYEMRNLAMELGLLPKCVKVVRMFIALSDRLNVPDLFSILEHVGLDPSANATQKDPWVSLHFHQISSSMDLAAAQMEAMSRAHDKTQGTTSKYTGTSQTGVDGPNFTITIAEAITPAVDSSATFHVAEDPRERLPKFDEFNRCIRLVRDCSRVLTVAHERSVRPSSYESVAPFVLYQTGYGEQLLPAVEGEATKLKFFGKSWNPVSLMMLDHSNFPGFHSLDSDTDPSSGEFIYWLRQLRSGSPFFRWREILVSARRSLVVEGDYNTSIILYQTAGEMLIDSILCLLQWEEGTAPVVARKTFDEKDFAARVSGALAPRIGGNWNTKGASNYAKWRECTSALRHKVVHAGYDATWPEVRLAQASTSGLANYCFDQLAKQRNKYPRATSMTLGRSGLEKRGLWRGYIKKFMETQANVEPNWDESFTRWRTEFWST